MGFERERAEMAVKRSGGLQGALEWLEQNQDKTLDDVKAETAVAAAAAEDGPALKPGEEARSLVCNECDKKFKSHAQAEFHASKTEHVDFSESTEEIAALTEDEKKAKLEELRLRLAEKRSGQSAEDKEITKRNEAIRRKATKETQDLKEDLQRKEQLKLADAKRREKQAELDAKQRIRAKIQADKEERRLRAEKEKAQREGRAPAAASPPVASAPAAAASPTTSKPASAYTETRLRLQFGSRTATQSFPVTATLGEVASSVTSSVVKSFEQNYPKKKFRRDLDFDRTLKDAGLVPSAVLVVEEHA